MTTLNGKIVEATENEMFKIYIDRGWDDVMPFNEFVFICEQNGTKVVGET